MGLFIVLYIIVSVTGLFIYTKNRLVLLGFLPALLLILDSGFVFFEEGSGATPITYFKAAFIFIIILSTTKHILYYSVYNIYIFLFIAYVLILLPFSNELNISFQNTVKALPPFFYFFIGIKYFQEKESINILFKGMALMIIASVIFGIAGYIWDIGYSFQYSKEGELGHTGMLVGGNLYVVSIAIVSLIVGFSNKTLEYSKFVKATILLFTLVAYILILLTMRRTAILLPLLGLLVVLLFNNRIYKDFLKYALVFALFGFLSFPIYSDLLIQRYQTREAQGRFEENFYETESRYLETQRIFSVVFSFDDINQSLFGKNVLAGGWKGGVARRKDHTDHAQILGTTGIIGAGLYILIYFKFFIFFWIFRKNIKMFKANRAKLTNLNSLYLSIILISLATGLNGSIFIITFRTTVFLSLGALVGYISKEIFLNKKKVLQKLHN